MQGNCRSDPDMSPYRVYRVDRVDRVMDMMDSDGRGEPVERVSSDTAGEKG